MKRPDQQRPRWRRVLRGLAWVAAAVVLLLVVAVLTVDRWLFWAIDPGPFDPSKTPAAPDYATPQSWAALPQREDEADVALPEYPAIDQTRAPAAVFFVHPTTALGPRWNAPIDDPATVEATARGATLIQASVFNECCAVYAPRYRQAHGRAFVHPDAEGDRAIEVAYGDVRQAFEWFVGQTAPRPFIVAGHSQGAVLATRLLAEEIAGYEELRARLVAAYLPGAPIVAGQAGIPPCDEPAQTGCLVTYNARGPEYEFSRMEFHADDPAAARQRLCVNPLSWRADGLHVEAADNLGAVFFDTEAPRVKAGFADAQCVEGALVVTQLGDLERDGMSTLLLWTMGPGNYHPVEYQLFYLSLRRNAGARVEAWLAMR